LRRRQVVRERPALQRLIHVVIVVRAFVAVTIEFPIAVVDHHLVVAWQTL